MLSAQYTGPEITRLRETGNFTELKTATTTILADPATSEYKKRVTIEFAIYADIGLNTISTDEEIIAKYNEYLSAHNLAPTTFSNDKLLNVFYNHKRYDSVIKLSQTLEIDKSGQLVTGVSHHQKGDFVNALKCYVAAEDWMRATTVAVRAGDTTNFFVYCSKAFNETSFKTAASAREAVMQLLAVDFTETTITEEDIKNLLITINRKYSAKLITEERTEWEPFIQLVRTTLDTYN